MYCEKVYKRNGKIYFGLSKHQMKFLINFKKCKGFLASSVSKYDLSAIYITLPHNQIKEKLTELSEQIFNKEGSLYLECHDKKKNIFSLMNKKYNLWPCQKVCDTLRHYRLDNISIRFGSKLYQQITAIPIIKYLSCLLLLLYICLKIIQESFLIKIRLILLKRSK